jgi:hypothetical protein
MEIIIWLLHIMFGNGTKCISIFGLAQKIWTTQSILRPLKGRGVRQLTIRLIAQMFFFSFLTDVTHS